MRYDTRRITQRDNELQTRWIREHLEQIRKLFGALRTQPGGDGRALAALALRENG